MGRPLPSAPDVSCGDRDTGRTEPSVVEGGGPGLVPLDGEAQCSHQEPPKTPPHRPPHCLAPLHRRPQVASGATGAIPPGRKGRGSPPPVGPGSRTVPPAPGRGGPGDCPCRKVRAPAREANSPEAPSSGFHQISVGEGVHEDGGPPLVATLQGVQEAIPPELHHDPHPHRQTRPPGSGGPRASPGHPPGPDGHSRPLPAPEGPGVARAPGRPAGATATRTAARRQGEPGHGGVLAQNRCWSRTKKFRPRSRRFSG
jgi:hypothetical protein